MNDSQNSETELFTCSYAEFEEAVYDFSIEELRNGVKHMLLILDQREKGAYTKVETNNPQPDEQL